MSGMAKYQGLSAEQLALVTAEVSGRRKSKGLAYILLLMFSGLGAHRFYIGDTGMGVVYILLACFGWLAMGIGWIIWCLLALVDLFTLSGRVDSINERFENEAIARARMMVPASAPSVNVTVAGVTPDVAFSVENETDPVSSSSGNAAMNNTADDTDELPEL